MRILLITDTHLAPSRPIATANWRAAAAFAASGGCDLTLHLGDLTRDGYEAADELPYAAALTADWPGELRLIPGNHDVGDNPPGEGLPTKQPLTDAHLTAWRTLHGEDRWALDVPVSADEAETWRLIGLNAQLFGAGTRHELTQWEFLADAVDDAAGRPLAVFSHKPFFQDRLADEPPHIRYIPSPLRQRLRTTLGRADWRLFLSGHTHQAWDRTLEGVRHIWVPSLAYVFPDVMQPVLGQKLVGAGLLTLLPDRQARYDLVIPDGVTQVTLNPLGALEAAHADSAAQSAA